MKVIYCPPDEDPMKLARQARQKHGGGGIVQYWWLAALAVFLVATFTVGPLKPKNGSLQEQIGPQTTPPTAEIAVKSELVNAFQGFCKNPSGGMIAPGDSAWITDGEQTKQVRCENGTFEEAASTTP